jgi:hypothetical protein
MPARQIVEQGSSCSADSATGNLARQFLTRVFAAGEQAQSPFAQSVLIAEPL